MRILKDAIKFPLKRMSYGKYRTLTNFYSHAKCHDKNKKYKLSFFYRKKKDKEKYYVFRKQMPDNMLFASGINYIFYYAWAKKHGFIPLLDMEYGYVFQQGEIGKENLWDEVFEQSISVRDVKKKNYVFVENVDGIEWDRLDNLGINIDPEDHYVHCTMDSWREYYSKVNSYIGECWKFKKNIVSEYEKNYGAKIKSKERILGVAVREEFSKKFMDEIYKGTGAEEVYANHPQCPNPEEILKLVKKYIDVWNIDRVFLSCAHEETVSLFKKELGERVFCVNRKRSTETEIKKRASRMWGGISREERYRKYVSDGGMETLKNRSISYVYEVRGLADCDYLIACKQSGTTAALVMNGGKYKDIFILPDSHHIERY